MMEPKFGDWIRGNFASERNPIRDGMYVRTVRRTGKFNPGKFYELTDGKGKFWQFQAEETTRLPILSRDETKIVCSDR